MWMHYSSQYWTEAVDLDSAIERLNCELSDLHMDALHSMNYDLDICYDDDEVRRVAEMAERYNVGAIVCGKYTSGMLNLGEFCEKMVEEGLKQFLFQICEFLPSTLIDKYKLNKPHDEVNESDETLLSGDVDLIVE